MTHLEYIVLEYCSDIEKLSPEKILFAVASSLNWGTGGRQVDLEAQERWLRRCQSVCVGLWQAKKAEDAATLFGDLGI